MSAWRKIAAVVLMMSVLAVVVWSDLHLQPPAKKHVCRGFEPWEGCAP